MSAYNIVTNQKIIGIVKRSKYFKVNLGMAVTMIDKSGDRIVSDKDQFAGSYNYQYKTTIYSQGNIGDLRFYIDHGIREDKIAAYYNLEEFIFDYNERYIIENGIDSYIGFILRSVDEMYQEMQKDKKEEVEKDQSSGVAERLIKNPGSVLYADIKKYIEEKRSK